MASLSDWESRIIRVGIFIVFVVTFGDYVISKIWPIIEPLFAQAR